MTLAGREGVSELRQSIKRDSKKILRHQIGKAMAVLFMVVSVLMFFTLVERICVQTLNIWGLSDLFALGEVPFDAPVVILSASVILAIWLLRGLVLAPLYLGQHRWYWNVALDPDAPVWDVFHYFGGLRRMGRSIWYALNLIARSAFYSVCMLAPPAGLLWAGYYFYISTDSTLFTALGAVVIILSLLLMALTVPLLVYFLTRYFLAKYIVISRSDIPVRKAFHISVKEMASRRGELFFLYLSFLPWALLSLLVIPILYFFPHLSTSTALYAHCWLREVDFTAYGCPAQRATEGASRP